MHIYGGVPNTHSPTHAPQEDPTQTDPPGSHAVRTASHKMEGFVGFRTVERCYQPMVVVLSPEVETTDLTVVHTCTRGPSRMPGMLLAPNGGSELRTGLRVIVVIARLRSCNPHIPQLVVV